MYFVINSLIYVPAQYRFQVNDLLHILRITGISGVFQFHHISLAHQVQIVDGTVHGVAIFEPHYAACWYLSMVLLPQQVMLLYVYFGLCHFHSYYPIAHHLVAYRFTCVGGVAFFKLCALAPFTPLGCNPQVLG